MKCHIYKVILAISLFSYCTKNFLDVENTQQVYRETYVKDLKSMQDYVRGTYYNLSATIEAGELHTTYAELVADNIRPFSSTSAPGTAANYNWTQDAYSGWNMSLFWKNCYMTVRMCSFAIDNVDEYRKEDPEWANNIKGQALVVRALIYFKLINTYAQPYSYTADASHPGVPYITTSDITKPYTRQSVKEVYTGMIADLSKAIELLPETTTDNRIMNRNAAKALLARVYLFQEDYTNAKTLAEEVVRLVPIMTIAAGYPNDIFKLKAPASTEALFQLSPTSSNVIGRYVRRTPIAYCATTDLASILLENSNDVRRNWIKDTTVGGSKFQLIKKFPTGAAPEATTITSQEVSYYTSVIRSSEMVLTAAEAAAKTGDESSARSYLNTIRKRANPSIADVNAAGTALIDSIYKERRKELSLEGLRMFDLQRWGLGVYRSDVLTGAANKLVYPNDKAISPLPLDEIRLAGIPQNIGY